MSRSRQLAFSKKTFLFNLHDKGVEALACEELRRLGATVLQCLNADVDIVVTDHASVRKRIDSVINRRRSSSADTEESSNSYQAKTTALIFDGTDESGKESSVCSTSDEALPRNGSRRRYQNKRELLAKLPRILKQAYRMGITIISYEEYSKLLKAHQRKKTLRPQTMAPTRKKIAADPAKAKSTVVRLIDPFIKVEDRADQYRPFFEQLNRWQRLNLNPYRRGCTFAVDNRKSQGESSESLSSADLPVGSPKRKRRAARKLDFNQVLSTDQRKSDSEGLTQPDESKQHDERRNKRPSVCEICDFRANDMTEHFASEEHKARVTSGVYDSLDEEISRGTTFKQFLDNALRRTQLLRRTTPKSSPRRRQGQRATEITVSSPSPRERQTAQVTFGTASPKPSPRRSERLQGISAENSSLISPSRARSSAAAPSPQCALQRPSMTPDSDRVVYPDSTTPYVARRTKVDAPSHDKEKVKRNLMA